MFGGFYATYVVLWLLALLNAVLIIAALHHLTKLRQLVARGGLASQERLPLGSPAPEFFADDSNRHQAISLRLFAPRGGILLFLSPSCSVCHDLVKTLNIEADVAEVPPIVAICRGDNQACAKMLGKLDPRIYSVTNPSGAIAVNYRVSGTPTAVFIDEHLKVRGYGHPANIKDLFEFVGSAQEHSVSAESDQETAVVGSSAGV